MRRLKRPSPAMVIALLALVLTATGVAVAAPTGKPKAHAARSQRGPRGFRGSRGSNGSRGFQGSKGNTGAPGNAGNPGAPGQPGFVSGVVSVKSAEVTLQPGENTYYDDPSGFEAVCPAGQVVIGTGFDDGGVADVGFVESYGNFVGGIMFNNSSVVDTVELQGLCAAAGGDYANAVHGNATSGSNYVSDLKQAAAVYQAAH
jgi:hypothetical protein